MEGYFQTDRGKVRLTNEDSGGIFYNEANQLLAIVADGMGGHRAGDVASDLAVQMVKKDYERTKKFTSVTDAEKWLKHLIVKVNKELYNQARKKKELEGMGTTVVLSLCTNEFVVVGHVGDSRCYLWNEETALSQLTSDHSYVNELVKTGQISELDAEEHPRKNVLIKAVGTDSDITPDIHTVEWQQNDCLLLCSDGLTNKIKDEELAKMLEATKELEDTAKQFISLANERGGEDNITLALVRNEEGEGR